MSLISVIIPARNAGGALAEQLRALTAQDYSGRWEVVVVDNGSTDSTADIARGFAGSLSIRVIDASTTLGAGAARNAGVAAAQGDYLLFADADDVVHRSWISTYAQRRELFATGPVVRSAERPATPVFEESDLASSPAHLLSFLPYALGANMALSREVFDRVGGFDARFRAGEDVDFSWRIQLSGTALSYARLAVVWKREPTGARAVIRQYYQYGRYDPMLYSRFRDAGVPGPEARSIARAYGGIAARVPLLWRPADRRRCVQQLGRRAGRVVGSIRERVVYL